MRCSVFILQLSMSCAALCFVSQRSFFFGVFHRQEIGDFEGERLDIEIDDFLLTIVVPGSCGCDGLTCFATCKPGEIFGEI